MDTPPQENPAPLSLRWGLLLYEILRLALLARIMASGIWGEDFAILAYGTANALFPLMALFLLVDFRRYAAYAPLYTAGKALMVMVLVGSGFLWWNRIIQSIMAKGEVLLYSVGGLLGIALGDLVSAGAGILLIRCSRPGKTAKHGETGEESQGPGGDREQEGA
jgi:hypothetical protein